MGECDALNAYRRPLTPDLPPNHRQIRKFTKPLIRWPQGENCPKYTLNPHQIRLKQPQLTLNTRIQRIIPVPKSFSGNH